MGRRLDYAKLAAQARVARELATDRLAERLEDGPRCAKCGHTQALHVLQIISSGVLHCAASIWNRKTRQEVDCRCPGFQDSGVA